MIDVTAKLRSLSTPVKILLGVGAALVVGAAIAAIWWIGGPRSAAGAGIGALLVGAGIGLGRRRDPRGLAHSELDLAQRDNARTERDDAHTRAEADAAVRDRAEVRAGEAELAARRAAPDVSLGLLGVDVGPRPGGDDGDPRAE